MSETSALARRGRCSRLASYWRGDRLVYLVFVAGPLLGFFGAALAGRPVIPGDDLTQNEPLRVLAGQLIRSGHLPAWDPFIWSGTPLLAGWNAAALFPGTFAFALLPAIPAWTLNYALAPALAACGMHLFLRRLGLRTLPAALGALVFTYTGFMSGQVVHIGLLQGTAVTPWLLVGINGVAHAPQRRSRAGWAALIAASSALVVLAGDPRAVSSAAIVGAVYLAFVLVEQRHRIARFLAALVGGVGIGAALSAIQWAPGIAFLHSSQRASAAYQLFSQGSFPFANFLQNLLVPFLIGGNANLGQPFYAGSVNPPEVTIGTGFVALVAVCAYLPELLQRIAAALRGQRRASNPARPLALFFTLAALGALLSLGSTTPLAHVLVHVPFFGGERLQNRNAAILDLALAGFVAMLLDDLLGRTDRIDRNAGAAAVPAARTARTDRRAPLDSVAGRLLALLPSIGAIGLIAFAFARPLSLERHLNVLGVRPVLFRALAPYLWVTVGLALVVGAFVVLARRLPPRACFAIAATLVLCDVLVYAVNAPYGSVAPSALSPGRLSAALTTTLQDEGRFALFDPSELIPGNDPYVVDRLGVPDLNIIAGNLSVQGYGSLVNGAYQTATGTHYLEDIEASSLASSTFDLLNLTTLLTMSVYLDEQVPLSSPVPLALANGVIRRGPGIPEPPPFAAGPWALRPGRTADFVLPYPLQVASVTVIFDSARRAPAQISVRAASTTGDAALGRARVRRGEATINYPRGTTVSDFSVAAEDARSGEIGAFLVTTRGPTPQRFILDGALQGVLQPAHWRASGHLGPFLRFTNTRSAGLAWLAPRGATNPLGPSRATGSVTVTTDAAASSAAMRVTTSEGATLVRSEGYAPGWTAELAPAAGGSVRTVAVRPLGLVQSVEIPPGTFTVTFRYAPATEREGLALSLAGALAFLAVLAYALRPRRSRDAHLVDAPRNSRGGPAQ